MKSNESLTNGNKLRLIIRMNNVVDNGYKLIIVIQNEIVMFHYTNE